MVLLFDFLTKLSLIMPPPITDTLIPKRPNSASTSRRRSSAASASPPPEVAVTTCGTQEDTLLVELLDSLTEHPGSLNVVDPSLAADILSDEAQRLYDLLTREKREYDAKCDALNVRRSDVLEAQQEKFNAEKDLIRLGVMEKPKKSVKFVYRTAPEKRGLFLEKLQEFLNTHTIDDLDETIAQQSSEDAKLAAAIPFIIQEANDYGIEFTKFNPTSYKEVTKLDGFVNSLVDILCKKLSKDFRTDDGTIMFYQGEMKDRAIAQLVPKIATADPSTTSPAAASSSVLALLSSVKLDPQALDRRNSTSVEPAPPSFSSFDSVFSRGLTITPLSSSQIDPLVILGQ
ncbi:MAG: hypothetical protein NTW08_07865 [Gammaproteobacteria bacterium]|nr:hypothetical protein [Gammaproteobacteria bacterium]